MSVTITAVAAEAPVTHRLNTYTAADMDEIELQRCIARPRIDFESILSTVRLQPIQCELISCTPPPLPAQRPSPLLQEGVRLHYGQLSMVSGPCLSSQRKAT